MGCKVPADMRLIELLSDHLRVDQAILTGKILSISYDCRRPVYQSVSNRSIIDGNDEYGTIMKISGQSSLF